MAVVDGTPAAARCQASNGTKQVSNSLAPSGRPASKYTRSPVGNAAIVTYRRVRPCRSNGPATGDEILRAGADRETGPLVPILGGRGAAVVAGDPFAVGFPGAGDPGAAGVPGARRRGQRRPAAGPGETVVAGQEHRSHPIGLVVTEVQQVLTGPHQPSVAVPGDHHVLPGRALIAREHHGASAVDQLRGIAARGGVDGFHPPVLGTVCRATDVQPPSAVRSPDQRGTFQRRGFEGAGQHRGDRFEGNSVGRAGDDIGVSAALVDRPAQPVGQVERTVVVDDARSAGPESGSRNPVAR